MAYQVGELDQRVSLQHRTLTDDGAGGATEAWVEYIECWAKVKPMTGRERQAAEREEATSNYLVVIRYRSDVLERDRITWRGHDLNVRFVRDAGPRPMFLEIEAEKGAAS